MVFTCSYSQELSLVGEVLSVKCIDFLHNDRGIGFNCMLKNIIFEIRLDRGEKW